MALPAISAQALAPYVTLLRAKDGKFTDIPAVLERGDVPGHHAFAILCPVPPADGKTVTIAALERHPHSTQSFLPIRVSRWIVMVAPALTNGDPDVSQIRAVIAGPEDAICIGRNVWHAGLTVLDRAAEVAMLMWKADGGDDGIVHHLDTPITLSVE